MGSTRPLPMCRMPWCNQVCGKTHWSYSLRTMAVLESSATITHFVAISMTPGKAAPVSRLLFLEDSYHQACEAQGVGISSCTSQTGTQRNRAMLVRYLVRPKRG